jgi:hypothetical protein
LHLSLWREAGEVRATGDEPHMAECLGVIAKKGTGLGINLDPR